MGSRRLLISITLLLCWTAVVEAAEWQDRLFDDYGLEVHGFVEGRGGYRLQTDSARFFFPGGIESFTLSPLDTAEYKTFKSLDYSKISAALPTMPAG